MITVLNALGALSKRAADWLHHGQPTYQMPYATRRTNGPYFAYKCLPTVAAIWNVFLRNGNGMLPFPPTGSKTGLHLGRGSLAKLAHVAAEGEPSKAKQACDASVALFLCHRYRHVGG